MNAKNKNRSKKSWHKERKLDGKKEYEKYRNNDADSNKDDDEMNAFLNKYNFTLSDLTSSNNIMAIYHVSQ